MQFREIFKPGVVWDFLGRRRVFFAVSAAMVLLSVLSLTILGFNKGIDFKGGTKIVVGFKSDAPVEREALREMLGEFLKTASGGSDVGQIEVQDFSVGSGATTDSKDFLLLTEITSLVTDEQKQGIIAKLGEAFPGAAIDVAKEGEDRFFVNLAAAANVNETYEKLTGVFGAAGFPKITVNSDVQRQIEVNNYRTLQMAATEDENIGEAEIKQREDAAKAAMAEDLKKRSDDRFTVTIEEFKAKLTDSMKQKYGDGFIAVRESTSVSPSVAGDMLNQGLVAILYAILGIIIYITLRFDVRYAPGAVIALLHDVFIVIGCFSIAQIKFTMPIIAAVLTIAGYSINDTIVVFDRIREVIEKYPKAPMRMVINNAVSQTLSRTVLTSATTQMAVLSIFLLGGGLIRDFAFAMCVGLVVGTYSSIFIASPLFLTLHEIFEARRAEAAATGDAAAVARTQI
ncbi:MAG: protein translocase subunit SecF [Deltaproteobacteria bacterium]|nr:protein translocase subunit SecF [Deltaproteobacteria bacterium]